MENYLKQGAVFGGKTWLGIPEGNLLSFIQSILVQQVTSLIEPSTSIGESKEGPSAVPKKNPQNNNKNHKTTCNVDIKQKISYQTRLMLSSRTFFVKWGRGLFGKDKGLGETSGFLQPRPSPTEES